MMIYTKTTKRSKLNLSGNCRQSLVKTGSLGLHRHDQKMIAKKTRNDAKTNILGFLAYLADEKTMRISSGINPAPSSLPLSFRAKSRNL
jgi:hypothetical protein